MIKQHVDLLQFFSLPVLLRSLQGLRLGQVWSLGIIWGFCSSPLEFQGGSRGILVECLTTTALIFPWVLFPHACLIWTRSQTISREYYCNKTVVLNTEFRFKVYTSSNQASKKSWKRRQIPKIGYFAPRWARPLRHLSRLMAAHRILARADAFLPMDFVLRPGTYSEFSELKIVELFTFISTSSDGLWSYLG